MWILGLAQDFHIGFEGKLKTLMQSLEVDASVTAPIKLLYILKQYGGVLSRCHITIVVNIVSNPISVLPPK